MHVALAPAFPSEPGLLEQVTQAVQTRTGGCIRGLRISVRETCVIISGRTSTYYNKQLVTHAIREKVTGMTVQNEIEVCR